MKKIKNRRKINKIIVNRQTCIGAAPCIIVAPNAFKLDKYNKAVVIKSFLSHTDDELLIAAQSCPVQAIMLFDENNKLIFPEN